jgi:4-amino-4-deoxy-L-arabinose transferase-like glycosyltransferase
MSTHRLGNPQEHLSASTTPPSWKMLLLIVVAALVVRIVCLLALQSWEFNREWVYGHEMGRIGKWLALGKGFMLEEDTPTAKFTPAYPFVVAGFFLLFGVYSKAAAIGLFLFQSLCAGVSAVCLVILGNRFFGRTAGLMAGCMWVIYPTSIFYSVVHIWYCEFAVMLLLLTMVVAVMAERPPTLWHIAGLGGLSGLIMLTDSTMNLYLPLLLLWTLVVGRVGLPKLTIAGVVWVVAAGIVVSPWIVRNGLLIGSPRLMKSNAGEALFYGNNPFSSGTNDRTEMAQAEAALDQQELQYYQSQSELIYHQYLRGKALEWIREHPANFVWLTIRRVGYFWGGIPRLGAKTWLRRAYYVPLIILALYGLWRSRHRWWHLAPVWLFLLVYPLPYYLMHVARGRYLYPVEPLVVLLAVAAFLKYQRST